MESLTDRVKHIVSTGLEGTIVQTSGFTAGVAGLPAPIGATVTIQRQSQPPLEAEVVGFRDQQTIVCPLGETTGIRQGSRVTLTATTRMIPLGPGLLGRVIGARGEPVDQRSAIRASERRPIHRLPPSAVQRPPINEAISTGIRSIDGLLTLGRGQRVGVFAGSGVGKSVSLGMIARYTSADVNVIALIGERGREVNEFILRDLGPAGLARSVIVLATSDEPAISRVQAAFTATCVAEYFRDQGKDVLLMMDSITRFAMAQREIGLAAGEPPTTRGYPPSVFSLLPRLVERAGRTVEGSITGVYSVLVEGDDTNEPISDSVRGLLDGHVVLSRQLASRGHYPAVDVLASLSRLLPHVTPPEQQESCRIVRELLAAYADHEDLISIGAYRAGSNPTVDTAIQLRDVLNFYLRQKVEESTTVEEARSQLQLIAQQATLGMAKE